MRPLFQNYLNLTKPRLTLMAVATASSGFYLGSRGPLVLGLLCHALIGAALVGVGANALNQYLEREADAKMDRTKARPLPTKKIAEKNALIFGLCTALGGAAYLSIFVNTLSAVLGLATLSCYLLLYTPLKQRTWLNTFIGAVSGALPTLIGWSAAAGQLELRAFVLFFILFFWQLPHFFAIAWVYRDDYKNGGFKMLPVTDTNGRRTGIQMALFGILLFLTSLLPTFTGLAGLLYLSAALFSGLLFLTLTLYTSTHKIIYAKPLVTASIFYLAVLNIFLWFDKI